MRPVVLVILDGYGIGPDGQGNAVSQAKKPNLDFVEKNFPFVLLQASGVAVGLPWGEPGNSEVGHTAIGTGQIWHQPLIKITLAIQDGSFYQNPVLKKAAAHAKENNSAWHIVGLLGSGTVHSYIDHLYALIEMAKNENVSRVWLHLFTDGRDSPPKEGATAIQNLQEKLNWLGLGRLASVCGRLYGMNRDKDWTRTQKAYQLITDGLGEPTIDFVASIKKQYSQGVTDEFIEPIVFQENGAKPGLVKDNDVMIFFDFREDSARQLTQSFAMEDFKEFQTKQLKNIFLATMTQYETDSPAEVIFPPVELKYSLAKIISQYGKKQFRIAETEKYAHITYFFNGGAENPVEGETRKLIHSLPPTHFDATPEMKAYEVADELISAIESSKYDFLLANFANADMLGHTGNFEAAIKAIKIIDEVIGKIMKAVLAVDGAMIITSDHGNADQMINIFTGETYTEHTANPVPFYLIMNALKKAKPRSDSSESTTGERNIKIILESQKNAAGVLQDVAATVLDLLSIPPPGDMDGQSLLPMLYDQ